MDIENSEIVEEARLEFIQKYRCFMANPGCEFLQTLGYTDESNIPSKILNQLYNSYYAYNRFYPPTQREDQHDYFIKKQIKYDRVNELISNHSNKFDEYDVCDLMVILSNSRTNQDEEELRKFFRENYVNRNITLQSRRKSIYLQKLQEDITESEFNYWEKFNEASSQALIEHIQRLSNRLKENCDLEISSLDSKPSVDTRSPYLRNIQNNNQATPVFMHLLNHSLNSILENYRGDDMTGSLLSSIETLYYANHIGLSSIGEISSNAMILFNSIISNIGYKPIPIYATDYAAYCLTIEDFSRYIIYIMQNVEGQEIIHTLPPTLKVSKDFSME